MGNEGSKKDATSGPPLTHSLMMEHIACLHLHDDVECLATRPREGILQEEALL